MIINLLLTLVSFKPVFKIATSLLILASACAAYFMDTYQIMIDKGMIQNVFGTDFEETRELLSIHLLLSILLLGVLPIGFLYKTEIGFPSFFKSLLLKAVIITVCLGILAGTLLSQYQSISFFSRENRELRHLINPSNYILSIKSVIKNKLETRAMVVEPIENDAKKGMLSSNQSKPSLVILVVGETARAMNFSLNGYERNTNPLLTDQDIINFKDVTSCGTATAISVPCMFSKFSRENYSDTKGVKFENLLDVVNNAGYDVLWRDNNTGCQGTCKRVGFESLADKESPEYCAEGSCMDEILLVDLQHAIDNRNKNKSEDKLIVLHPKGNHGPTYHRRYPKRFEVFKPTCKTNQLRSCSKQEVVNAYDNAVLYTDYFLAKSIEFLKQNAEEYNTALVYMSDHGESLGENNLYLHGFPYMIAPEQQKKVPFILWLSQGYQQAHLINTVCVAKKTTDKLSHDNLFSSMLGLLDINTKVHDSKLDIFTSCRQTQLAKH